MVYCTAIAEGGIEEWEFALRRYKTEKLAAEKARLQSALACSEETWILSKYVFSPIRLVDFPRHTLFPCLSFIQKYLQFYNMTLRKHVYVIHSNNFRL